MTEAENGDQKDYPEPIQKARRWWWFFRDVWNTLGELGQPAVLSLAILGAAIVGTYWFWLRDEIRCEPPVGTIAAWLGEQAPDGWAICNGQAFDTSWSPKLNKMFSSGNLPNLQGYFLRGHGQGSGDLQGSGSGPLGEVQPQEHNFNLQGGTVLTGGGDQTVAILLEKDRPLYPENIAVHWIIKVR